MKRWEFTNDHRGVSEIYGTVLIISLVLLTALVIVGFGAIAVQDLTEDSDEDVTRQSVLELDKRLTDLAESSVDEETTIEFNGDVQTNRSDGKVVIEVKTHEAYWDASPDLVDADDQTSTDTITMGSIFHEDKAGLQTAYQGGGVWEKQGDKVEIVSAPGLSVTNNTLGLSFVNISNVDYIQEGNKLTIRKNASASELTSRNMTQMIRSHISRDGNVTANASVKATIKSEYAAGWYQYAQNNLADEVKDIEYKEAENKVIIKFGYWGDGMEGVPPDYNNSVIYSGVSEFAPDLYDDSNGEIKKVGSYDGFEVTSPGQSDHRIGVYAANPNTDSDTMSWWVWDYNNDEWRNVENSSAQPVDHDDLESVSSVNSGKVRIANSTWTCVVRDDSFAGYVKNETDDPDGCMQEPVAINDPEEHYGDFRPELKITNFNLAAANASGVATDATAAQELRNRSHWLEMEVTVKNVGTADAENIPVATAQVRDPSNAAVRSWMNATKVDIPQGQTKTVQLRKDVFRVYDSGGVKYKFIAVTKASGKVSQSTPSTWKIFPNFPVNSDFEVVNSDTQVNGKTDLTAGKDKLKIKTRIQNTADDEDTQIVQLRAGPDKTGRLLDTAEVNLKGKEPSTVYSETVNFGYDTVVGDESIEQVTIVTDDDTYTFPKSAFEITAPSTGTADFDVDINDDNSDTAVTEGEQLNVSTTIKNTGKAKGSVYAVLKDGDGTPLDGKKVTVDKNSKVTKNFTWDTSIGDAQNTEYVLTIEADDETDDIAVDVNKDQTSTNFKVDIQNDKLTVKQGDTLTVDFNVTNTGSQGTQKVVLRDFDGSIQASKEFTLDKGESKNGTTLSWETGQGDAGKGTLTVATTDGNSAEVKAEVLAPGEDASNFTIRQVETPSEPIQEGDDLNVSVTINNTGDTKGTQIVSLKDFDGNLQDFVEVTLQPGEEITLDGKDDLIWATEIGDAGQGQVTVTTEDDTKQADAQINAVGENEPQFNVSIDTGKSDTEVTEGEWLNASVVVGNEGDSKATKQVWLKDTDGNTVDIKELTIAGGDTQTVELAWKTELGDATDSGQITAATPDGDDTADVTINEKTSGTTFDVSIDSVDQPVTEGDAMDVTLTVTNNGTEAASKEVWIEGFGGNPADSVTLDLDAGETANPTLTWQTEVGDAGTDNVYARTPDDSAKQEATVDSAFTESVFNVSITSAPESVLEGDNLTVRVAVTNTGNETDTKDVWLEDFDGQIRNSTTVSDLAPGDSAQFNLTWETEVGDSRIGETIRVASPDDDATEQVDVVSQDADAADFQVFDIETNSPPSDPIKEGEQMLVNFTVRNDGGAGSQNILLRGIQDNPVNVTELTLSEDETKELQLIWNTLVGDNGTGSVTVESEDDDASADVEIEPQVNQRPPMDVMFVLDESASMASESTPSIHTFVTDTSDDPPYNLIQEGQGHLYLGSNPANNVGGMWRDGNDVKWDTRFYKVFYTDDNPSSTNADWTGPFSGDPVVSVDNYGFRSFIVYPKYHYVGTKPAENISGVDKYYNDVEDAYKYEWDEDQFDVYWYSEEDNQWYKIENEGFVRDGDGNEYAYAITPNEEEITAQDPKENKPNGEYTTSRVWATKNFAANLTRSGDQAGVVQFDDDATSPSYYDSYGNLRSLELDENIGEIGLLEENAGSSTNIGAGLGLGVDQMNNRGQNDKQIMVLLTDGFNNEAPDYHVLQQAQRAAENDIQIYTVGLGPAHNPPLMKEVANMTGGKYYPADDASALNEIFKNIRENATESKRPTYEIESIDHNSSVSSGDTVVVDAQITNTGAVAREQPVTLQYNGIPVDSQKVNISVDDSEVVQFTWDTTGQSPGNYDIAVVSSDDKETGTVEITEALKSNFVVQIDGTNSPVANGEKLTVDVTITNDGDIKDTQTIYLQQPSGEPADSVEVTLEKNSDTQKQLVWQTDASDAGIDQEITVSSDDTNATDLVTIEGGQNSAEFLVQNVTADGPVTEGDDLNVTATIRNDDSSEDTQYIVLKDFDGEQVALKEVTVSGGETKPVNLTWATERGDAGTGRLNVSTNSDEGESNEVEVKSAEKTAATFSVQIANTNAPITEGDTLSVTASITNEDDVKDTQFVVLEDFDGNQVGLTEVTLTGGETESVTLEWNTNLGDSGTGDITVATEKRSQSREVKIEGANAGETNFVVESVDTNATITEGETLEVTASINNTGETADTQYITLDDFNGTQVGFAQVGLEPGQSKTVTMTWDTVVGDAGQGDVTVSSNDDSLSETITIAEKQTTASQFEVNITTTNADQGEDSITVGEELVVDVTVNNTGEESDTQNVWLEDGDGTPLVAKQDVSLEPGENTSFQLTWETESNDYEVETVRVSSDDDADSQAVDITEPASAQATFEVGSIDSNADTASDSITEGDTLIVNATITNTGDGAEVPKVELRDPDTGDLLVFNDTTDQIGKLQPDETAEVKLKWDTESGDNTVDTVEVVAGTEDIESKEHDVYIDKLSGGNTNFKVNSINSVEDGNGNPIGTDTNTNPLTVKFDEKQKIKVKTTIKNSGTEKGSEVVQLFRKDTSSGSWELVDVKKVKNLQAGNTREITLTWEGVNTTKSDELKVETASGNSRKRGLGLVPESRSGIWKVDILESKTDATDEENAIVAGDNLTVTVEVQLDADLNDVPFDSSYLEIGTPFGQNFTEVVVSDFSGKGDTKEYELTIQTYPGQGKDGTPQKLLAELLQATDNLDVFVNEAPIVDPGEQGPDDDSSIGIDIDEIEIGG